MPGSQRSHIFGRFNSISNIGFIIGPVIGGYVVDHLGGFHAVAMLTAGIFMLNFGQSISFTFHLHIWLISHNCNTFRFLTSLHVCTYLVRVVSDLPVLFSHKLVLLHKICCVVLKPLCYSQAVDTGNFLISKTHLWLYFCVSGAGFVKKCLFCIISEVSCHTVCLALIVIFDKPMNRQD